MSRGLLTLLLLSVMGGSSGCMPGPKFSFDPAGCATTSFRSLDDYDQLTAQFLDENTRHPASNLGGGVVWNTRYYLESLVTAYSATGNPKYLQAFEDTGAWVLNLVQTISVVEVSDPSAPGKMAVGPMRTLTGWPTYMATFAVPVAIPTANGQVALYAQSLFPTTSFGASHLMVTQQPDGSLELAWWRATSPATSPFPGNKLETFSVQTLADLNVAAAQPLVYGQTPGRMKPTGLGLPAPGIYEVDTPLQTIWHAEQTGGILLPFARFLLIAKDHPELVDPNTVTAWKSKILSIAADYEDDFVPDGSGGLLIHNPDWIPSTDADTNAPSDYAFVEASLRILLFKLTGDPDQLSIARGLVLHHKTYHWQINPQGWLLLKFWPCIRPWSTRKAAPAGSIWDSLTFDPSSRAELSDGDFFAELLDLAKINGVSTEIGLTEDIYAAHRKTFQEFLRAGQPIRFAGSGGLLREAYPVYGSAASDPVDAFGDIDAGSGFLTSELADASFIAGQWIRMNAANENGADDASIGYFLRAWARAEAAANGVCQSQKTGNQ
jgi:hypothetical protein